MQTIKETDDQLMIKTQNKDQVIPLIKSNSLKSLCINAIRMVFLEKGI